MAAIAILTPLGEGEENAMTLAGHIDDMFSEGNYFYVDDLSVLTDDRNAMVRPVIPDYEGNVSDINLSVMRNYVNGIPEVGMEGQEGYIAPVPGLKIDVQNTNVSMYRSPNAGYITIQKPVMVGSSYRDEGKYRLPVTVRYVATSYFTEDI